MPSYAHLTQFSATDPLPLTLGAPIRPAAPEPAPCQTPWLPKVGDLVDTDCGPVLRGAKVLVCRPDDTCATVGDAKGIMAFLVPKSALRPAVTPKPAAGPTDRQQIRVAWDTSNPDDGWKDETPSLLRSMEWRAANYVGARLERRTLEA